MKNDVVEGELGPWELYIYIYICIVDNILILIITSESTLSPIYVSQKRKEGERYFLRWQYIKGNSFQGGSGKSEPFSRYFDKHVKNVSRVYAHALYMGSHIDISSSVLWLNYIVIMEPAQVELLQSLRQCTEQLSESCQQMKINLDQMIRALGSINDSLKLVVEDPEPPAKRLRVAHASPETKNAEKKKAEG